MLFVEVYVCMVYCMWFIACGVCNRWFIVCYSCVKLAVYVCVCVCVWAVGAGGLLQQSGYLHRGAHQPRCHR